MKVEQKYLQRFEELLDIGESVLQTKFRTGGGGFNFDMVDSSASYEWGMKCLSTLAKVFGENNRYYIEFNNLFKGFDSVVSYENTRKAIAVLKAARDDYKDGYTSKQDKENIIKAPAIKSKSIPLQNELDTEAKRNTRIYLSIIFASLFLFSIIFFYFFGLKNSFFFTIAILISSYFFSALSLKEWTPTKLPERLLEYEKDRIHKRFGIDED
ncbi:MAG TPA: hypothetical protein VF721_10595 [Pyrinomonadaceae bacterium]|jgi:hypothetical protein